MADGREVAVWTNHAVEQWRDHKQPHVITEDYNLRKWLVEVNPQMVLDYGCGSGLWRNLFKGCDYYGYDQNENMIAHAKKRFPDEANKFHVIEWNGTYDDIPCFDLIFTSAVLQHNKHPDKVITMKHILQRLKPGGYFMCTENTFRPDNYKISFPKVAQWNDTLDDGYSLTKNGWERFMKPLGLKLLKYADPSDYLYIKE